MSGRKYITKVVVLALAGWLAAPMPASPATPPVVAEPAAPARKPRSVVILLDVSSSMDDIFVDVQHAAGDFIQETQLGDFVSLITFSDEVAVVAGLEIQTQADRDALADAVLRQEPQGRYTDVTTALSRGMSRLRRMSREMEGERIHYLLLLTDGRHNPRNPGAAPSFDDILTQYERARPGEQWYLHYIALGEERDAGTEAFVAAAGGQTSWLRNVDRGAVAAALAQLELPFLIVIRDFYGDVTLDLADGRPGDPRIGAVLVAGDVLRTGPHAYAVLHFGRFGVVGVESDTVVEFEHAVHRPITNAFEVALWVPQGRLISSIDRTRGNITFQVNSPQVNTVITGTDFFADVDPGEKHTTVAVLEGKVEVHSRVAGGTLFVPAGQMTTVDAVGAMGKLEPVAEWMTALWGTWQRALRDREELRSLVAYIAAVQWSRTTVSLGPLLPGRTLRETVQGHLGPIDVTTLTPRIEQATFPPEVRLEVFVQQSPYARETGDVIVQFAAHVDPDWEIEYSTSYRALVRLVGPTIGADLEFVTPLTFTTLELVVQQEETKRAQRFAVSQRQARRLERAAQRTWMVPVVIGVGLLAYSVVRTVRGGRGRRRAPGRRRRRFGLTRSATPNGHLLLRRKPAAGSWNLVLVDLERLCTDADRDVLSVGRSRENLLVLPDQDLYLHHAEIRALRQGARRILTLRLLEGAIVGVNGEPATERQIELTNGMWLRFGHFTFTYYDSDHDTAVEIGLSNGAKLRGALRVWDAGHRVLEVAQGRDAAAQRLQVLFSEIEYVAFAEDVDPADTGPDAAPHVVHCLDGGPGPSAAVTFKSGRVFQGAVSPHYDADQEFFYFFPAGESEVEFMLISHLHVDDMSVSKPASGSGPA